MPSHEIRNTHLWREFERLVSRVERTLAGDNVTVATPDRIRRLITGRLREVDASLRAKIGSADILVTIECRKRSAKQDVTWMEQLSAKKQAIGAARTIAVSSAAFSHDAVLAAAHYGIDVRVASEVSDADMRNWILPVSVMHVYKSANLIEKPEISFYSEPADDFEGKAPTGREEGVDTPVFETADGNQLTLNDLWLRVDDQMKVFDSVPVDDQSHIRRLAIKPSDDLYVITTRGRRCVCEIKMALSLRWKHEEVALKDAKVILYESANPTEAMSAQVRAEFESKEASHMNLRLGMQFIPGSDQAWFSVDVLPGTKKGR